MAGLMQVLLGVCLVAVIAGVVRASERQLPQTTAGCLAAGGKCVTPAHTAPCGSMDKMCVGHCDEDEETCLLDKDDRCEKLRGGKCMEAAECASKTHYGPCYYICKNGRVCCMPDSMRSTWCWRGHRRSGRRHQDKVSGHAADVHD
ncbi:hypothetical protein LSAT2_016675 [Lamellibrachia satsuma]|nr:hypothetical protein LSAT2_016675 [Lamellibrachia satsuma]